MPGTAASRRLALRADTMTAMCSEDEAPTPRTLASAGLARVLEGWAERLSIAVDALSSSGTRFFARHGATVAMVIELGSARVFLAPPAARRKRWLPGHASCR